MSESAKKTPFLVKFRQHVYDLTEFVHKHPGGITTMKGLENMDMGKRFLSGPPHSDAAMYLMREYRVEDAQKLKELNGWVNNGSAGGVDHNHNTQMNGDKIHMNGNGHVKIDAPTDESMEHMVDWSKAMLPQISKLGDKYTEWVNKPVDRPLRLFTPTYLEMLTKTPWWMVPVFWVPAISYIFWLGWNNGAQVPNTLVKGGSYVIGLFLWTLIEYLLHRFLFHMDTSKAGTAKCLVHFLIHGLHHKVPFDEYRLVFPPVPAIILATAFYMPILGIFSHPKLVLAGGLTGYLVYDMIHFYLHYGSPAGGHLYYMKRYHYQHHFVHHEQGFGISSQAWDVVFDTKILLRRLKSTLKWK